MLMRWTFVVALVLTCLSALADPHEVRFPADAGVIDIKQVYGAVGDGKTDDTQAIQRAMRDLSNRSMRILYFPNGTYLVRDSLSFGRNPASLVLQGQSESGVTIRLMDNSPGFDDPENPRPLINMFDVERTNVVYGNGFFLYLRNMTIDTGAGNPGATGIRFLSNNTGGLYRVTVRTSDPNRAGVAGIICDRRAAGPSLLKHVTVEGFRFGLLTNIRGYNLVFEYLTLRNQTEAGISSAEPLTIRKLTSHNSVPVAIIPQGGRNQDRFAQLTLVDAELTGGSAEHPAIRNGSFVYLRNVRAEGYARLVENTHPDTPNLDRLEVDEYVSDVAHSLFPSQLRSLNLPIEETPIPPYDPPENWVRAGSENVRREHWQPQNIRFVFVGNGEKIIQDAIDKAAAEGKHTVYIANLGEPGERTKYYVSAPIRIHGSVRRIVGLGNDLEVAGALRERGLSVFIISKDLISDTLWIEDLQMSPGAEGRNWNFTVIDHQSDATLVLRNIGFPSGYAYKSSGRGKVFLECVVGSDWHFNPGQKIWARQFNTEGFEDQTVLNGNDMWVLGLKTEQEGMVMRATNSRLEVIGGFLTPSHTVRLKQIPEDRPAFMLVDSEASINVQFAGSLPRTQYLDMVVETRDGETRRSPLVAYPLWGGWGGGTIQLFSSVRPQDGQPSHGFALREFWHADESPETIDDRGVLTSPPRGRTHPSAVVMPMVHGNFQPPAQLGQGYVERYRFFVNPPVTGDYEFTLRAAGRREQVRMWISPEGDPQTAQPVKFDTKIRLNAAQPAYVEVLTKRFDTHTRGWIGWKLPDGTQESPIGRDRLVNAIVP